MKHVAWWKVLTGKLGATAANQSMVELPDMLFYKSLGLTKTFERPNVISLTASQGYQRGVEGLLPKSGL